MKDLFLKLVEPLVAALESYAETTATRIDDAGVKVLKAILENDELTDWLQLQIFRGWLDDEEDVSPEVLEKLAEVGVTEDDYAAFSSTVFPTVNAVMETLA